MTAQPVDSGDYGVDVHHRRASTPHGPDYCEPCSEKANDWVPWEGHLSNAETVVGVRAHDDWREKRRTERAIEGIERAKRYVMDLFGGNLDHPALDHLDAAITAVRQAADIGRTEGSDG